MFSPLMTEEEEIRKMAEDAVGRAPDIDLEPLEQQISRRAEEYPALAPDMETARSLVDSAKRGIAVIRSIIDAAVRSFIDRETRRRQERSQVSVELTTAQAEVAEREEKLEGQMTEFAVSVAQAGLSCSEPTDAALDEAVNTKVGYDPTPWEERQRERLAQKPRGLAASASGFLRATIELLLGVLPGLFLAVAGGKVTGFVDLSDLEMFEPNILNVGMFALGIAVVMLAGYGLHEVTTGLVKAKARGERSQDLILFAVILAIIWVAEATAEGYGIYLLAKENAALSAWFGSQVDKMPLAGYLVVGTLISSPYFVYKVLTARRKAKDELVIDEERGEYETRQKVTAYYRNKILDTSAPFQTARAMIPRLIGEKVRLAAAKTKVAALQARLEELEAPVTVSQDILEEMSRIRREVGEAINRARVLVARDEIIEEVPERDRVPPWNG